MKSYLPLFDNKKEVFIFTFFIFIVFVGNIAIKYMDFLDFKQKNWATIRGNIVKIIPLNAKNGREYKRVYLKSDDGLSISIAYFAKDTFSENMRVGFRVKTEDVSFSSFLSKRFFASAVLAWSNEQIDESLKLKILDYITSQHEEIFTKELYGALFLATPISKELRQSVQIWGIAHIIAISGFHLGLIFGFSYFLLKPIYQFFQNRYFPYRNIKWDISILIFAFLGWYLWLIDMTPSFLRSYVMGVCGFLFLSRGINIISFEMLGLTSGLLVAFFPHLLFNIGFLLSVCGVFFIFVFLKHFNDKLKKWQIAILINFWLFFAMSPIIYYYFGVINIQQLASIPLSLLFALFYPLVLFLHIVGFGGILDDGIIQFLNYKTESIEFFTPLWLLFVYLFFAILSAYRAIFMLVILIISISYFFNYF